MASDNEASCVCDPNFAVICSFLERFGKSCGITYPDFAELQEMIENTQEVAPMLIDLHIKLLRKARKSVNIERWERALVKFCHTYSNQDGWEIERFGYKKARVSVKLQALKNLLEEQFDSNQKFKTEVNRLTASELRLEPLGRDRRGYAYWCQMDEWCNLRIYREDLDEETWKLVAKSREGLVNLISELSSNETATGMTETVVNEDSNSLGMEKPIIDTGQEENKDSKNIEHVIKINEEDTSQIQNNTEGQCKEDIVKEETKPESDDKISKVIIKVKTDMFEISKPAVSIKGESKNIKSEIEVEKENKIDTDIKLKNEDKSELLYETSDNIQTLKSNLQKTEDTLTIQENVLEYSKDTLEKSEDALKKPEQISEKLEDALEKPEQISEKLEHGLEKAELISEKSEYVIDKSERAMEKSECISEKPQHRIEKSEDNSEKSEHSLEKIEHSLEKPEQSLEKPEQSLEKSEQNLRKSEQTLEKSEQSLEKSGQSLEISNYSLEKSEHSLEKSDIKEKFENINKSENILENDLKKNENSLFKSEVLRKFESDSVLFEEKKLSNTAIPFKISVRKDLIISPSKGLDVPDSEEIEEKQKISSNISHILNTNEIDTMKISQKISETNITMEPIKKSIRIKTVPKKVIEIPTNKSIDQSILKKLSTETSLDPIVLKKLSNLEDIKINPTVVKTNLSINKCERDKEDNRKPIVGANISISAANISITPQSLNPMKKIMNMENPFSPITRYKGTQENIRGMEDLIDNIYSNVGVDLSNKSGSYLNAVHETDGLDLSKKSHRNDIQMHEIDLSTKKPRDELLNTSSVTFHGLPLNLEKTVSFKRGLNTLDDEYVIQAKKKKSDEYSSNESSSGEEVSEEIEEPVMLVQGEGSGKECEGVPIKENSSENSSSDTFWCSDVIEEPLMLFYGSGSGHDCNAGNTGKEEESSTEERSKDPSGTDTVQNIQSSSSNDNDSIDNNRDKTDLTKSSSCKESENTTEIMKNKLSDVRDENICSAKFSESDLIKEGSLESSEKSLKSNLDEKTSGKLSEKVVISEKSLAPLPATKRFLQSVSADNEEGFKNPVASSIITESEDEMKKSEIDLNIINKTLECVEKESEDSNKEEVLKCISIDSEKQGTKLIEKTLPDVEVKYPQGSFHVLKETLLSSTSSLENISNKPNVSESEENKNENILTSKVNENQKNILNESTSENIFSSTAVKSTEGIKKTTFFFGPGSLFNKPESKKTETSLISKKGIFETKNDDTKAIIDEIDATIDFMKSDFPQHSLDKHIKSTDKYIESMQTFELSETIEETDIQSDTLLKEDGGIAKSLKSDILCSAQKNSENKEFFCVNKSELENENKNISIPTSSKDNVLNLAGKESDLIDNLIQSNISLNENNSFSEENINVKIEDKLENTNEVNVIGNECVKQINIEQKDIDKSNTEEENLNISKHESETTKIDLIKQEEIIEKADSITNEHLKEFQTAEVKNASSEVETTAENLKNKVDIKENLQEQVLKTQDEAATGTKVELVENIDKHCIDEPVESDHIDKNKWKESTEESTVKNSHEKNNTSCEDDKGDVLELKMQEMGNSGQTEEDSEIEVKDGNEHNNELKENEKSSDVSNTKNEASFSNKQDIKEKDVENCIKKTEVDINNDDKNIIAQTIKESTKDSEKPDAEDFNDNENKNIHKIQDFKDKIEDSVTVKSSDINHSNKKNIISEHIVGTLIINKEITQENVVKDIDNVDTKISENIEAAVSEIPEKEVISNENKIMEIEDDNVNESKSEISNKNTVAESEQSMIIIEDLSKNILRNELECTQSEILTKESKTVSEVNVSNEDSDSVIVSKNSDSKQVADEIKNIDLKSLVSTDANLLEKTEDDKNIDILKSEDGQVNIEDIKESISNDNIDSTIALTDVNKLENDGELTLNENLINNSPVKSMDLGTKFTDTEKVNKESTDDVISEVESKTNEVNSEHKLIEEEVSNKNIHDVNVVSSKSSEMDSDKKIEKDENNKTRDSEKLICNVNIENADDPKKIEMEIIKNKDSEQVCNKKIVFESKLKIQKNNDVDKKKNSLSDEQNKMKDNLSNKIKTDTDFSSNVEMGSLKTKEDVEVPSEKNIKESCFINSIIKDDDDDKNDNLRETVGSSKITSMNTENKSSQKSIEDLDLHDETDKIVLKSDDLNLSLEIASTSKITENLLPSDSKSIILPPKKHFLESESATYASGSDYLDEFSVMPKKKFKLDPNFQSEINVQKRSSGVILDTDEKAIMSDSNGDDKKVPKLKLDNVPTDNTITKIESAINNDVLTLSGVECDTKTKNEDNVIKESECIEVIKKNQVKEKLETDVVDIQMESECNETVLNTFNDKVNKFNSPESAVCDSATTDSKVICSIEKVSDESAGTLDQLNKQTVFLKEENKKMENIQEKMQETISQSQVQKDINSKNIDDTNVENKRKLEVEITLKPDDLTKEKNKLTEEESSIKENKVLEATKSIENLKESGSTLNKDILKTGKEKVILEDQKTGGVSDSSKANILDENNSELDLSLENVKASNTAEEEKSPILQDNFKKSIKEEQCIKTETVFNREEKDSTKEKVVETENESSKNEKYTKDTSVVETEKSSETPTVLETRNDDKNDQKLETEDNTKLFSAKKSSDSDKEAAIKLTESVDFKPIEISNVISLSKDIKPEKTNLKENTDENNTSKIFKEELNVEKRLVSEVPSVLESKYDVGIKKVLRSSKILDITKSQQENALKDKDLSITENTATSSKKNSKVKRDLGTRLNVETIMKEMESNKTKVVERYDEDNKDSILDKTLEGKKLSDSEQAIEEKPPKKIKSKPKGKFSRKSKAQRKRKQANISKMKKTDSNIQEQKNDEADEKIDSDIELKSTDVSKRPLLMCVDINKLRGIPDKSAKQDNKVLKEKSLEQSVSSRISTKSDDSVIGIDTDSMELGPVEDPLACTEESAIIEKEAVTPKKTVTTPVINITDLKFDVVERTTRSRAQKSNVMLTVPPVDVRRKRSHEIIENTGEVEETSAGKRRRTRNKRSVDVNLRRSIEQQKQMEVSSSDEENVSSGNNATSVIKKKATVPKVSIILKEPVKPNTPTAQIEEASPVKRTGRRLRSSANSTTVVPVAVVPPKIKKEKTPPLSPQPAKAPKPTVKSPKAEPRKRKNRLLGLDIDTDLILSNTINSEQESETPVRQSRRIAQIKIKEEAERRKIEEFTLAEMKSEQKKKKKTSDYDKNFKLDHRKRKGKAAVDDESTNDSVEKKKKKKKKKHRKGLKFDELNPWKSSSGSSSSNEEEEEDVEEVEELSEEEILFKSDHEFSPESDLEENTEVQPLRRARTAKVESDAEEADEHACQQCGKSDHPEWILLCDSCDCGWHCSCLRPALLVIPEGDWFCPPCQHITLVTRLKLQLQEFDKLENQLQQKQRIEYSNISASNILSIKEDEEQRDFYDRSDESGTDDSQSSGSGGTSSDSEPIYQLRQRRQVNSYLFSEYDNLIKSAIQDEMEAVKGSAGNQGRGKDISTIVNAEKEESEKQKLQIEEHENLETPQVSIDEKGDTITEDHLNIEQSPQLETDAPTAPRESSEEEIPPVVVRRKQFFKKKHTNLTNLDITSEEDNQDSDEDFKGSSSEDDEEDYDDAGSEDSDDFNYSRGRRKGSLRKSDGPLRRSTRARITRYDRDFINDDSDDDAPRKKKSRSIWDESESEDSDKSWGRRRSKPKRHSFPSFRKHRKSKSKSKKKRHTELDPDSENPRPVKVKKPRIKYGGLDELEEDENESPMRRTRGRKINYLEALGTDSEEEALKSTVKPLPESEDEYIINEEEEEDEDLDKFETKSESERVIEYTQSGNIEINSKLDLLEFKTNQEDKELGPNSDSHLNLSSDLNLDSEPKLDSEFALACESALNTKSKLDSEEKLNLEQKLGTESKSEFEQQLGFGLHLDSESKLESVLRARLEDNGSKFESINRLQLMSDENRQEIDRSITGGEEMLQPFSPLGMSDSLVNLKTIRRPQKSRSPRGSRVLRGFGSSRQPRNPSMRGRGRGSRGGRRGLMGRPPRMFNEMQMKSDEKNSEENLNANKSELEHLEDEEEELEEGEIPKSVLREMSHLDSDLEEDMDEEEIAELMMEEEEFANKQLERAAAQIARDKKRKEREAKREEKFRKRQERLEKKLQKEKEKEQKDFLRKQKEEERQRLREQFGENAVKEPKRRGRKKKSEIEAAAAAMALASGIPVSSMSGITTEMMMASSSETIASAMSGENSITASTDSFDPDVSASTSGENKSEMPMLPKLVVRTNLFNPPTEHFLQSTNPSVITGMGMGMGMNMGMGMDITHSPPKRRGRGKGKKTLAAEAAAAAAAEAVTRGDILVPTGVVPPPVQSPLGGHLPPGTPMQTSPIGMLSQGSPISKASTPTDLPIQGGKLGIVAPPQPFTQTQPTPSVITRMLQSQPMSGPLGSQNFSASLAHKYFSGAQNSTGNPPISSAGPPVSLPGGSASAGPPPSVSPGLPPVTDSPSMRGPPPGPFPVLGPRGRIPSPYRQGPHNIPSPHYTPGSTPPPHVRLPVSSANVAQIFHTGHHPLDPSPSGGGPISIGGQSRDRNSPAFVPPSASSPLTNKGTPPPPPYSRPSPLGRFSAADVPPVTSGTSTTAGASPSVGVSVSVVPNVTIGPSGSQPNAQTSVPVRHHIPFPQQGMQQPSPSPPRLPGNFNSYHSQPPPSYHYGAYPPPPSMAAAEDALPPPAYQGSPYPDHYIPPESQSISQPLSDSSNSKPFEEDSGGEFGGLVSYFSSQREDDLDS